ncbi:carboxymuconolactone decarboxylase family protein [Oligoflexus tunisiensis]|uniref:carboxymuconolactone decarboxylase family protein n=1 Tax=Oligoflexus tunisiensis TaxID=708132 RepID=UPI001C404CA5|nr:peroxidase-related enzyme [Oligoflexus tunisiensis]
MFLKDVEAARKGRYGEMIEKSLAAGHPVSGIWHLFAYKPAMTQHLSALTEAIMRGPSPLTVAQRELIAAVTSSTNRCPFCTGSHVAAAAELYGDEAKVHAACTNPATAPLTEAEKTLLFFIQKITKEAYRTQSSDIEELKAAGWSDEAIYDAIAVCSLFNFYNRWNDANGTPAMQPEGYAATGKRLATKGYV